MKNKPTLEEEAVRLREVWLKGGQIYMWEDWENLPLTDRFAWLQLAHYVRMREQNAFKRGCKGVAEFGRKFESLAHTK